MKSLALKPVGLGVDLRSMVRRMALLPACAAVVLCACGSDARDTVDTGIRGNTGNGGSADTGVMQQGSVDSGAIASIDAGSTADAGVVTPPRDSGTTSNPDAAQQPPRDAGFPAGMDATPVAMDAGTASQDATPSATDAGSAFPDATSVAMDATTPPADAGTIPAADGGGAASPMMSFFVTSIGNGAMAGNYGGLSGADARCQMLAGVAGAGSRTWRAYLSVNDPTVVHAKDRIGAGPWYDHNGGMVATDVADLHARGLMSPHMLTEMGEAVPGNDHDILTGTLPNGEAMTSFPGNPSAPAPNCRGWTSNSGNDYTYVGHADWSTPETRGNPVWNSSHETPCSQAGLNSTGGSGRLYCFAID